MSLYAWSQCMAPFLKPQCPVKSRTRVLRYLLLFGPLPQKVHPTPGKTASSSSIERMAAEVTLTKASSPTKDPSAPFLTHFLLKGCPLAKFSLNIVCVHALLLLDLKIRTHNLFLSGRIVVLLNIEKLNVKLWHQFQRGIFVSPEIIIEIFVCVYINLFIFLKWGEKTKRSVVRKIYWQSKSTPYHGGLFTIVIWVENTQTHRFRYKNWRTCIIRGDVSW